MDRLSDNDRKVLAFVREQIKANGYSPTLFEIKKYLPCGSLTTVQRSIYSLEEKGLLKRDRYSKRGISLIESTTSSTVNIPLYGVVTCGTPILAIQNLDGYIPTDKQIIHGDLASYFYLRAKGDSMNKAGIDDGDLLLFKEGNAARSGDIVVALIDDSATVKKFRKGDGFVALEPESTNTTHKPIIMHENFIVQGILVKTLKA